MQRWRRRSVRRNRLRRWRDRSPACRSWHCPFALWKVCTRLVLKLWQRSILKPVGFNALWLSSCKIWSDIMKARIKWVEDRTFVGESGTGHKIVLGTASEPGGRTPGPSSMELVLMGTGVCTAFDVLHILER